MKFISKFVEGILFAVLFFSVVMPLGYVLRKLSDPHCLKRHKTTASYFNRRSASVWLPRTLRDVNNPNNPNAKPNNKGQLT
ncbi:MAG: hypothetical protein ACOH2R_22705 [Pseudomonas sp.]